MNYVILTITVMCCCTFIVASTSFDEYESLPCLLRLYTDKHEGKFRAETHQSPAIRHAISLFRDHYEESILVRIKLLDHIVMYSHVLEGIASVLNVADYRDFQFGSGSDRTFTTRVTPKQLVDLKYDKTLQSRVEWIKRVPESEKMDFSLLTLDSLQYAKVHVGLSNRGISVNAALFEQRLNMISKWKNWYQNQFITELRSGIERVKSFSPVFSYNIFHNGWFEGEQLIPHSILGDTTALLRWFEDTLIDNFALRWEFQDDNDLHIGLQHFDFNVWNLKKRNEMESSVVQMATKRDKMERLFKRDPTLATMWNDLSNSLGDTLFNFLKNQEAVDFVVREFPTGILNYGSNQVVQSGGNNNTYLWNNGITGEGQVISIIDTGVDVKHCFYSQPGEIYNTTNMSNRKIVHYEVLTDADNLDLIGHGTHAAGTILGNVASGSNNFIGVAKDAKLYVVDASGSSGSLEVSDLSVILANALSRTGSKISSNSWGCASPFICSFDCVCTTDAAVPVTDDSCIKSYGRRCCQVCVTYDSNSYTVDNFLNKNDEVNFVVASGNDGAASYNGSVADPASAKNVITVGASHSTVQGYQVASITLNSTLYNMEQLAYFSSRGNTIDGRIKPDIVAPGYQITSAKKSTTCGTTVMSGTSMATPAVAGATALVRQYLTMNNNQNLLKYELLNKNPQTLSGSLIKAILINSGEVMTGNLNINGKMLFMGLSYLNTPNSYSGFGRVNLKNVLPLDHEPEIAAQIGNLTLINRKSLEPGSFINMKFVVTSNTDVKMTITWYDLAGTITYSSTAAQIRNDIDLKVTIQGKTYFGNSALTNNQNYDAINTVETVYIPSVPIGTSMLVTVSAKTTNKGSQTFSMCMTGSVVSEISSATSNTGMLHIGGLFLVVMITLLLQ